MSRSLEKMKTALEDRLHLPAKQDDSLRVLQPRGLVDVRRSAMGLHSYKWVLILFALVCVYYVALASDRYATTAQVYVKATNQKGGINPAASFLNLATPERQDAFLVEEFFQSRDLLSVLEEKMSLKAHYSDSRWDMVARLKKDATAEEFLEYFQERATVKLSPDTSILTLEVQAFTPEFSAQLADEILRQGEIFINNVSQNIAEQELQFVRQEVERAQGELSQAQNKIAAFQKENRLLSPQASGEALQLLVNALETDIARANAEEKRLRSYLNDNAGEVIAIRATIDALTEQLAQEKAKIAFTGQAAINDVGLAFKRLELELELATALYTSSLTALEQARLESYRKLKHLVVVQSPSRPDEAIYPRKIYNLATVFVVLTLIYGILSMVMATIREHRDV